MKLWVKRYLLITLCFVIVMLPIVLSLKEMSFFQTKEGNNILWIIFTSIAVLYYLLMTLFMLKGKNNIEKKR